MDRDLFIRLTGVGRSKRIPGPALGDFRVHDAAKSSTLLDVAEAESTALIQKYGRPSKRFRDWLLRALWWWWCKPTGIRVRLNKWLGLEL